jgi:hypothetical protein
LTRWWKNWTLTALLRRTEFSSVNMLQWWHRLRRLWMFCKARRGGTWECSCQISKLPRIGLTRWLRRREARSWSIAHLWQKHYLL